MRICIFMYIYIYILLLTHTHYMYLFIIQSINSIKHLKEEKTKRFLLVVRREEKIRIENIKNTQKCKSIYI